MIQHTCTGQRSNPGRFARPGNVAAWDRYAYVENNPLRYTDPSGHRVDEGGGGCEDTGRCKLSFLERRSNEILVRLGGKDDLEAMAQIVDVAAILFPDYRQMIPALTWIFNGKRESTPYTLLSLAFFNRGCAGVGRDEVDCPANLKAFNSTGFHDDFFDGHNQLFHFWAYVSSSAAKENTAIEYGLFLLSANPFSTTQLSRMIRGTVISTYGNVHHEILDQDAQSSWEDYALSVQGMVTGWQIGRGLIKPEELGDYLRHALGPASNGSYGWVPFLKAIVPLQGNQ